MIRVALYGLYDMIYSYLDLCTTFFSSVVGFTTLMVDSPNTLFEIFWIDTLLVHQSLHVTRY